MLFKAVFSHLMRPRDDLLLQTSVRHSFEYCQHVSQVAPRV